MYLAICDKYGVTIDEDRLVVSGARFDPGCIMVAWNRLPSLRLIERNRTRNDKHKCSMSLRRYIRRIIAGKSRM